MAKPPKKSVVVVGGGTGLYTLLRGLRVYRSEISISAIVTMADSGGSTGRLRDEFGQLPVGDIRQALAALAPGDSESENIVRELFLHRFSKGDGLSGHNVGNLLLTALAEILGNEYAAIEAASRLLNIAGKVIPVTTDNIQLVAEYLSGVTLEGEHNIDEGYGLLHEDRIVHLYTKPNARIFNDATVALKEADLIVLGPGDLYTSILANCVIEGFSDSLLQTQAKILYVANLMSRRAQTVGMDLNDYINEIKNYTGIRPDYVLVPDNVLPSELVSHYYEKERVTPVVFDVDLPSALTVIKADIVSHQMFSAVAGDVLVRSLLRHDSTKLSTAVYQLLHSL